MRFFDVKILKLETLWLVCKTYTNNTIKYNTLDVNKA